MIVRVFALVSGFIYLIVGILGFVPSLVAIPAVAPDLAVNAGYGYLLGIFPINALHNLVHLGVGVWGLLSYRSYASSRTYSKGLALFYGVLALMGFLPVLRTTFGLIPIFGNDIWLHAVTALIAATFGLPTLPNYDTPQEQEAMAVGGRDRA